MLGHRQWTSTSPSLEVSMGAQADRLGTVQRVQGRCTCVPGCVCTGEAGVSQSVSGGMFLHVSETAVGNRSAGLGFLIAS